MYYKIKNHFFSLLKATEGTVRLQTQKMKYYKSVLEDHGLVAKSPTMTRSNSETDLACHRGSSRIPVRKRSISQDDLSTLGKSESMQVEHKNLHGHMFMM